MASRSRSLHAPSALLLASLAGSCVHIPPAVDLAAPLPPAAVASHGFDVLVSEHIAYGDPLLPSLGAAGVMPLGDGSWGLELGGNLGASWLGAAPALHWVRPPKPASAWRFGGRLGLALGAGDAALEEYAAYAGASLLGQASRTWGPTEVGTFTIAAGWGYAGHLLCFFGCSESVNVLAPDGKILTRTTMTWVPYNGPTLHLRLDLPLGRRGTALTTGASAQPVVGVAGVWPIWTLSLGLHYRRPAPW